MVKKYLVLIAFGIGMLMIYGLIQGTITGNFVKESSNERIVIYFPHMVDMQSTEEGTIVFDYSFPSAFKVGNKTADVLMFLNSDKIPGLKIGYDTKAQRIYAGLPALSSVQFDIFDGQKHKLAYTFHKGNKKQALYLDDKVIAQGEYTGEESSDFLTGFSIYKRVKYIESPIGINVRVE